MQRLRDMSSTKEGKEYIRQLCPDTLTFLSNAGYEDELKSLIAMTAPSYYLFKEDPLYFESYMAGLEIHRSVDAVVRSDYSLYDTSEPGECTGKVEIPWFKIALPPPGTFEIKSEKVNFVLHKPFHILTVIFKQVRLFSDVESPPKVEANWVDYADAFKDIDAVEDADGIEGANIIEAADTFEDTDAIQDADGVENANADEMELIRNDEEQVEYVSKESVEYKKGDCVESYPRRFRLLVDTHEVFYHEPQYEGIRLQYESEDEDECDDNIILPWKDILLRTNATIIPVKDVKIPCPDTPPVTPHPEKVAEEECECNICQAIEALPPPSFSAPPKETDACKICDCDDISVEPSLKEVQICAANNPITCDDFKEPVLEDCICEEIIETKPKCNCQTDGAPPRQEVAAPLTKEQMKTLMATSTCSCNKGKTDKTIDDKPKKTYCSTHTCYKFNNEVDEKGPYLEDDCYCTPETKQQFRNQKGCVSCQPSNTGSTNVESNKTNAQYLRNDETKPTNTNTPFNCGTQVARLQQNLDLVPISTKSLCDSSLGKPITLKIKTHVSMPSMANKHNVIKTIIKAPGKDFQCQCDSLSSSKLVDECVCTDTVAKISLSGKCLCEKKSGVKIDPVMTAIAAYQKEMIPLKETLLQLREKIHDLNLTHCSTSSKNHVDEIFKSGFDKSRSHTPSCSLTRTQISENSAGTNASNCNVKKTPPQMQFKQMHQPMGCDLYTTGWYNIIRCLKSFFFLFILNICSYTPSIIFFGLPAFLYEVWQKSLIFC